MTPITKSAALLILLSATLVGCADKSLISPATEAVTSSPQAPTNAPTKAPTKVEAAKPAPTPTSKSTATPIPSPTHTAAASATPHPTTAPSPVATTKPAADTSKVKSTAGDKVPYSWYYMKKKTGQVPDFPKETKSFTADQKAVWVGTGKKVYLTIDAGGPLIEVDLMLKSLKENGVKANFFISGNNIKKNPDYLKRVVADGHFVANHTMTHNDFNELSDDQIRKEITDFEALYKKLTGKEVEKYFRFPYGHYNMHNLSLVSSMGYTSVFWSTAMRDWEPRANGAEDPYNDIMNNLHDGNIILMHQGSLENMQALSRICKEIKKKGYEFALVNDLQPKK
ncbi:polysaccharide deacetylase family protein [Paenibacillus aceris]|uniref:Peptidoglycan-N-acetylmuramic acid deacetylase n=1 Tax=Paenibacillus aceris TaxID=869555 RepID=A0ABS4HYH6_9BACL|nr:polysaccharide deacetylase family protein [Paenibacillus aceris]MBP1963530.1 peptidoglycan-N-acetylmuramic acid deacetylase [Paenibacillus aceris]NHW36794.1 polysaccharide deacetylase family protein [Paenibacillus aceris]